MPRQNQYAACPIIPGNERRPSPPAQLDTRERRIWSAITARLPADWVTAESAPMLKELCRHIRSADDLWVDLAQARAAIDAIRKTPAPSAESLAAATQEYRAVLRAHGYQTERIGNSSTKLRLTPQARYPPRRAAKPPRRSTGLRRGTTGVSARIANNSADISTGYPEMTSTERTVTPSVRRRPAATRAPDLDLARERPHDHEFRH
jgi:hypothetical protein